MAEVQDRHRKAAAKPVRRTRPWTFKDQLEVVFYGAPLHLATLLMIDIARFSGMGIRLANRLSRANNRFISTFRSGGRRVISDKHD